MHDLKKYLFFLLLCSCKPTPPKISTLFTEMPANYTGINFENKLSYDSKFNVFTYRNFYNGGGVALGDINNDGLIDVFLTSNMGDNKLFLNKGNFQFEDISKKAGIAGTKQWSTGATLADVNADGWLDIYVCNSGDVPGDDRSNELFINQKDLSFIDQAPAYGIADKGLSTHAAFFDYDHDNDLDLYVLNNSFRAIGSFNLDQNIRNQPDTLGGDKLYRNDNGKFKDVSAAAGIYQSVIGFGLGITVGDLNKDGWLDMYVSNDFFERDYLYINNQKGGFTEELTKAMPHISLASMGADMADINNDTYPDIFSTDMLPESDERLKRTTSFESWDVYQYRLQSDYYHQFTENALQLNNGNGSFSDIARLANVGATDWSWGALIADFDNDMQKDIFVANGILHDLTDQDYVAYISNESVMKQITASGKADFKKLIDAMPTNPVPNYFLVNKGNLTFENQAQTAGLGTPSHSNGSAYGDLDNDGDLDLITNNTNTTPFVYRNNSETLNKNNYISVKLVGKSPNNFGIGAKITVFCGNKTLYQEAIPSRGFQSAVDNRLHFGIAQNKNIDSLQIIWSDGLRQTVLNPKINQLLSLNQSNAVAQPEIQTGTNTEPAIFTDITPQSQLNFAHKENYYSDFNRDRMLFHMLSTEGPASCKGDLNSDGLEDIFIGGAKGQAGKIFLQQANNRFVANPQAALLADSLCEDVAATFFDADQDGDQDLFVVSGGNEFLPSDPRLLDRLYINKNGRFEKSAQKFDNFSVGSCVRAADYDQDGDQDLFLGSRIYPSLWGVPTDSYLFVNDGKGRFENATYDLARDFVQLGMVTDAQWTDLDADKDLDLIATLEWGEIKFFKNSDGKLFAQKDVNIYDQNNQKIPLSSTAGWWQTIHATDLDNDGDTDFILGNWGLNCKVKASNAEPATLYVNDFDQNGTPEQLLSYYKLGNSYLQPLRGDLVQQMPILKKQFTDFKSYANVPIVKIFKPEVLAKCVKSEVYNLQSSVLIQLGKNNFMLRNLPIEAQISPVFAITTADFNADGKTDILLGGNFYSVKPELTRYDASYCTLLLGNEKGEFTAQKSGKNKLNISGEVRGLEVLKSKKQHLLVVAKNNAPSQVLQW